MWIKAIQAIDTPQGRLMPGDVGEVYDPLGVYMKMRGRATHAQEPKNLSELLHLRLTNGAGEACVFSPYLGEFGHAIMWHMRLVDFHGATRKVVCTRRGWEVLYPTADAFDYDWVDPVEDQQRAGTDRMLREWPAIERRHPGHRLIQSGNTSLSVETITLCPGRQIKLAPKLRGIRADVCIGTRARKMDVTKNWSHWQRVAAALQARGLTVAVIGTRDNSYPIPGAIMSGDYGDVDAAVDLLQNCRLYLGTDSGSSHLASICGPQMLVLPVQVSKRYLPRMQEANPSRVEFFPDACWDNPELAIQLAVERAGEVGASCKLAS
jgi:hypothetical protein